ncbi:MAG: hypothetical protein QG567_803 [Campylobacterota bacterium]|nr:hypothetical protein [Campylobacterota bacterium]
MKKPIFDVDVLSELLSMEFARNKRYKTPVSVAVLLADNEAIFETISENIRDTDYFQYLGNNLYGIIYTNTDIDGAEIAIKRVIRICESLCNNEFYIGLVEVESGDQSEQSTTARAISALEEGMANKEIISIKKSRKEPSFFKKLKFLKCWR